jgi:mono/diheme cytochrome c family protein
MSCPVLYRAGLVVVAGIMSLVACGTPNPVLPPPPTGDVQAAAQRGHDLATGFGACGFCHSINGQTTAALSGGRRMRDKYGDVYGPNITLAKSGIGEWSEADFKNALRTGVRPDGSDLSQERHRGFEWLADSDVAAITVYLRSLAASENEVASRRLSFLDRNTTGLFDTRIQVRGVIPSLSPAFKAEFGQYLTDHVARCGSCHSKPGGIFSSEEYLAGGQEISFDGEEKLAPNITSSTSAGIGSWSEQALREFLQSGRTPTGREVDGRFCPVQFYARAPQAHIEAVVAYLRSVPAVN